MRSTLGFLFGVFLAFSGCDQRQQLGRTDDGTCRQGLSTCGASCVDTFSDPDNCGGCGIACGPGKVCQLAECQDTCFAGYTACDGACVSLSSDDLHCGSCDNYCSGDQHCGNNACFSCPANTTACLGPTGRYWSCADFQTDNLNCGSCGVRCDQGQRCTAGNCR